MMVVRRHRASGVDVDHTRTELFQRYPFLVDSPGVDLIDGLDLAPTDTVVVKRRWSAFFGTDLDMALRRMGIETVILAGVQTPNCIRATANDATSLDYHCVVLSDATASATPTVQAANLSDMAAMGVEITTVDAAITRYAPRALAGVAR